MLVEFWPYLKTASVQRELGNWKWAGGMERHDYLVSPLETSYLYLFVPNLLTNPFKSGLVS